jgi:hypothetical protein
MVLTAEEHRQHPHHALLGIDNKIKHRTILGDAAEAGIMSGRSVPCLGSLANFSIAVSICKTRFDARCFAPTKLSPKPR